MCQGKFVPHEWTLNSISPHHRLIARTEYFMWQAFYIVFSAGFWFENSFFLIDDRGYRPWMLNCKEILSPYLLKFWLSVVICTYKYMYNIVIGFFIEIMKLGRVASMISDLILFMTDQSSPCTYLLSRVYSYLWPVEVWTNLRICVEYECIILFEAIQQRVCWISFNVHVCNSLCTTKLAYCRTHVGIKIQDL